MMERSNVYLDSEDKKQLKEIAKIQGINYSQALRKAMRMYIVCYNYFSSKKDGK